MGGITGKSLGYVTGCINNGIVSYSYSINNKGIGGIVGIQTNSISYTYSCQNYGAVMYSGNMSTSQTLQPCMGQIIGHRENGFVGFYGKDNYLFGNVDTTNLRVVGVWNQAKYAGSREIGKDG